MHDVALLLLCGLAVYVAYHDAVALFVEWYSGIDPPRTAAQRAWMGTRIVLAFAATTVALWTR